MTDQSLKATVEGELSKLADTKGRQRWLLTFRQRLLKRGVENLLLWYERFSIVVGSGETSPDTVEITNRFEGAVTEMDKVADAAIYLRELFMAEVNVSGKEAAEPVIVDAVEEFHRRALETLRDVADG